MTSSPKRPWFRFHLLTLVLMMFVAGFSLMENLHPQIDVFREYVDTSREPSDMPPSIGLFQKLRYGWPFKFHSFLREESETQVETHDSRVRNSPDGILYEDASQWNWWWLAADVVFCILLMTITALVSESLIRRREARKP